MNTGIISQIYLLWYSIIYELFFPFPSPLFISYIVTMISMRSTLAEIFILYNMLFSFAAMWKDPITSKTVEKLREMKLPVLEPVDKMLACLDQGIGALAPVQTIFETVCDSLSSRNIVVKECELDIIKLRESIRNQQQWNLLDLRQNVSTLATGFLVGCVTTLSLIFLTRKLKWGGGQIGMDPASRWSQMVMRALQMCTYKIHCFEWVYTFFVNSWSVDYVVHKYSSIRQWR